MIKEGLELLQEEVLRAALSVCLRFISEIYPQITLINIVPVFSQTFDQYVVAFLRSKKYTVSHGEVTELAEGARLLSECPVKTGPRVQIPASPP